jgi:4-amino-4-deoxy-L-arabinose transferase-like glycosyltransferase
MLALLGQLVSAAMGVACVGLAYATVRRLWGWCAGAAAGFLTAFSYPILFYAHTTNVEIPYLFWTALALYASVRLLTDADGGERRWFAVFGGAAAMAVSTKELVAPLLVALGFAVVAVRWWREGGWGPPRGALAGVVSGLAVMVIANNVLGNPLGFLHRVQFLTHTIDPEVRARYAPYYFPIEFGGHGGLDVELTQLRAVGEALLASLGWPTALLAAAGLVIAAATRPLATAVVVMAALGYYVLGLRAMIALTMRYVLPVAFLASLFAGVALDRLLRAGRVRALRVTLALAAAAYAVGYGWDVDRMLAGDGRYDAEAWLASLPAGARIEVYQRPTYLPRVPSHLRPERVGFDQIDTAAFRQRRPDYVLVSTAGIGGLTIQYAEDWQGAGDGDGDLVPARKLGDRVLNYQHRRNRKFLTGLVSGRLRYRPVASFGVDPWIERPLINSLNPQITIYARVPDADGEGYARATNPDADGRAAESRP